MGFVFHDAWDQSEVLEMAGKDILENEKMRVWYGWGEMMVEWKKESSRLDVTPDRLMHGTGSRFRTTCEGGLYSNPHPHHANVLADSGPLVPWPDAISKS